MSGWEIQFLRTRLINVKFIDKIMLTEENSNRQWLRSGRETGRWPWWVEYPLVITTTAATLLLHKALGLGEPAPIVFLFPIIICAYIGGLWPGLVSTGLSALTASFGGF